MQIAQNVKPRQASKITLLALYQIALRKNGIVSINSVSEICEIDMMMVEYFTTNESAYSGILLKSSKNASPYILVSCSAPPNNMEKIKNKAIL